MCIDKYRYVKCIVYLQCEDLVAEAPGLGEYNGTSTVSR
jgi:hypothetical protein